MADKGKQERQECAIDALIVSAIRRDDTASEVESRELPKLTDEETAGLLALGDDFIDRIWNAARSNEEREDETAACEGETIDYEDAFDAGAVLNRADAIDQKTKDELAQKKREILEQLAKEKKEKGGSGA